MLGDPHRIQERRWLRGGVDAGRRVKILDFHPRDLTHPLRGILLYHVPPGLEPLRSLGDELPLLQPLFEDDMGQPVKKGHIGSRPMLKMKGGVPCQIDPSGVGQDEPDPTTQGPPQLQTDDGVLFCGIGTDDQKSLRLRQIAYGVGHGSASEGRCQTGHRTGMTEACTMIDIVTPYHRPGELLDQVVLFVGSLG